MSREINQFYVNKIPAHFDLLNNRYMSEADSGSKSAVRLDAVARWRSVAANRNGMPRL